MAALPSWFMLERQLVWRALSRAWAKTGKRIAARMAMMAMTTSSSMSVKARRVRGRGVMKGAPCSWKTGNKKRRLREMEAARRGHCATQGTHVVRVLAAFLRRYDPVQVPG